MPDDKKTIAQKFREGKVGKKILVVILILAIIGAAVVGLIYFKPFGLFSSSKPFGNNIADGIITPGQNADIDTRVTALEKNQNNVIIPTLQKHEDRLNVHEEALKLLGQADSAQNARMEKLEKKTGLPTPANPKTDKKIDSILGSAGSAPASSFTPAPISVTTTSTAISTAGGIKNTLDAVLYVVLYGDWDGAKIVALNPGEVLPAGFPLGGGKTLQTGVHLNLFTLYNNGVTHSLDEIFSWDGKAKTYRSKKTQLATYYWSNGLVPITGDTHYNKAFTILGSDNLFHDGYKVTEKQGGHDVAVAVDTFDVGRLPTRTLRF